MLVKGSFTVVELNTPKLEAGRLTLLPILQVVFWAHRHLLALQQELHFFCSLLKIEPLAKLFPLSPLVSC